MLYVLQLSVFSPFYAGSPVIFVSVRIGINILRRLIFFELMLFVKYEIAVIVHKGTFVIILLMSFEIGVCTDLR